MVSKVQMIVVGGFLGSGKTTLLAQAARHFAAKGKRVGIITNDQAADLVDTHLLASLGVAVEEVAGGCFCCRFEDLERTAANLLHSAKPDVILSEPLGSCTDISATVLQPVKQKWSEWMELAAFSVLADPRRLQQIFYPTQSAFPDSVRYIIQKQVEEADYLVINKADLVSAEELTRLKQQVASVWPGIETFEISALHNRGVAEWLQKIMSFPSGGTRIIDVDYDIYARGEAELGWLNASLFLVAREKTDWEVFARELISRIHRELTAYNAEIGHVKLLIFNSAGQVISSITGICEIPWVRNNIGTSAGTVSLIVNARALVEPQLLKSIAESSISAIAGEAIQVSELSVRSFRPGYPRPTHRFGTVVT